MTLSIESIPFNKEIKKLASMLNANIFFVGGTVRDLLLNKNIHDVDIVIFNLPYTFYAEKLKHTLKAHLISFKDNVRIIKNHIIIDISKPRGNSILEDLKLRDFTINSMALSLEGHLINYTEDLKNRCICVQYNEAFIDDPLRMLRAFRLASELDFYITKDTINKTHKYKKTILKVARERIYEELYKTFTAKHFKNIYPLFIESQLFNTIFNLRTDDTSIKFLNISLNNYFLYYNNYSKNKHFIHTMILFVIYHYLYGDNNYKNNILNNLNKIIIVKNQCLYISKILKLMDTLLHIKINKNRLGHIVFNNLTYMPDIIIFFNILTISGFDNIKRFERIYNMLKALYNSFRIDRINEINGIDIKKAGVPEGKILGKFLKRAQYYLITGECTTKEDALLRIKKLWGKLHEVSKIQN